MKTQIENTSNLGRKMNIDIPAPLVTSTMNRICQNFQKKVELKGFRKGKAPKHLIVSLYSQQIKSDTINELLRLGFSQGLMEHKLNPINYPKFEYSDVEEGSDFNFSALFDVSPSIELKFYEGLELEKTIYKVQPNEVEDLLKNIQNSKATKEEITDSRPAQFGDIAEINFKGFVEDKPLEQGEGTNHPLELGSNRFIPGFEQGIVGMAIGESKTLNLKFPENYQAHLSNKEVKFEVTLNKLWAKVLPELNDELAKSFMGGTGNLEDLKKAIFNDIDERRKKKTDEDLRDLLFKKLINLNPLEAPSSIILDQKNLLIEDAKLRMKKDHSSDEEIEQYIEKWDLEIENRAKEMIQIAYLVDAIANKHNLHGTQDDFDKRLESYANSTGVDLSRVKEFYSKEESMNRLMQNITHEKVTDFLLSKANIKEIESSSQPTD